jgi:hypothetical protein
MLWTGLDVSDLNSKTNVCEFASTLDKRVGGGGRHGQVRVVEALVRVISNIFAAPSQSILTVSGLGGRAAAINEFSGLLSVSMTSSCVEDKREELTLWLAASIGTSSWVERTRARLGVPTLWGKMRRPLYIWSAVLMSCFSIALGSVIWQSGLGKLHPDHIHGWIGRWLHVYPSLHLEARGTPAPPPVVPCPPVPCWWSQWLTQLVHSSLPRQL